jgi:histidinol-phosphatase (PHP family)
MITFGSDAHTADVVAADFNAAVDIAKAAGFTHYTVYNDRKPKLVEF